MTTTSYIGDEEQHLAAALAEVQRERDELRASFKVAHEQHQRREATLTDRVANLITDVEELRGQREFAMRELRAKIGAYDALATAANERLVRMAKAEAAVKAVRELHRPYRSIPDFDVCAGCSIGMEIRAWPCPTVAALDGAA